MEDYNTNVFPIVTSHCGSCHTEGKTVSTSAPGFVGPTAPTSPDDPAAYMIVTSSTVVGSYTATTAPVLLRGLPNGHAAGGTPTPYSSTEQTAITNWLELEAAARNGSGGGVTTSLMQKWSGCLTQTNFDAANMAGIWGNIQANGVPGGNCKNCHATGENTMVASDVGQGPSGMFALLSNCKACILQYFSVDLVNQKIIVNTTNIPSVVAAKVPHSSHPVANNNNNPNLQTGMTALTTFYTSTMASLTAGTCGPPKF
jgi:hypothetical protein